MRIKNLEQRKARHDRLPPDAYCDKHGLKHATYTCTECTYFPTAVPTAVPTAELKKGGCIHEDDGTTCFDCAWVKTEPVLDMCDRAFID